MTVAQEILNQLGGRRFIAMTGAKNLTSDGNALIFRLPSTRDYVKEGINVVKITLTADDDYTVEFSRMRGLKFDRLHTVDGVYCDMLQDIFTSYTGLDTTIGAIRRA